MTIDTPTADQALPPMRVIAGDIDFPAGLVTMGTKAVLVLREGLVPASVVALLDALLADVLVTCSGLSTD